jgi:DNA-directed RNA polymerase specialized sigma24 family protein
MNISQKQLDDLMRVVRWRLRSFSNRNDWDDILGVAYLGMWTDIVRCQNHPRFNYYKIGVQGALWEALSYVKKAKRIYDSECQLGVETDDDDEILMPLALTYPDCAINVLDRMDTEQLLRCLTNIERDVLIRYHVEGMTFLEIATAHGKNSKTWGFNNVRAAEKKLRAYSQEISSDCRS